MVRIHMYKDTRSIYLYFESEECCEDYGDYINEKIDRESNWRIKEEAK